MRHNHSHKHKHSHAHAHPHRILIFAVILLLFFAAFEAFGSWWTGSLALLGDAGHIASDAVALTIAAFAGWLALKPPSHKHSYGLGRAEVVAAWISSLAMLLISIMLIIAAIHRLRSPSHVAGGAVAFIALMGIIVNSFVAWLLARGERTLNVRAALLHVMGDIAGSVGVLIAGAVIHFTGWLLIDPILSIFIGILILISSLSLLRESLLILMESVPGHINFKDVNEEILSIAGVKNVHDLHIWTLSSGKIALSAHIDIHELSAWQMILTRLMQRLKEKYEIDHLTLQPEPDLIDCQPCSEK